MDEKIIIEIEIGNRKFAFDCSLQATGYTHKIQTSINGINITLEPDEERNYRAIISNEGVSRLKDIERQAIKELIEKLENIK